MIEVYHNSNFLNFISNKTVLKENLNKVANVHTSNLEKAFVLTQNIDTNWTNSSEVETELTKVRSTSAGDVLLKNGIYYCVDLVGFFEIDL